MRRKKNNKLPKLKSRQSEIIHHLYRFRFLDRRQIQTLLEHKHHSRVNLWLIDLIKKDFLGRKRLEMQGNPNSPYIYHLRKGSIKYLKRRKDVNPQLLYRIYSEHTRKPKFIKHCITLADAYLFFKKFETDSTKLHFFPKTDLKGVEFLPPRLPDAYFAVTQKKKDTKRYFLKIFDENTQRFVYKKRLKEYIEYADGQEWELGTSHTLPNILFVCPDEASKDRFAKLIVKEMEEEINEISFYLTVKERINPKGKKKGIWEKVIYE